MRGTTLEVAMLADVSGAYSAIVSIYQFVTRPLWHEPSSAGTRSWNNVEI